MSDQQDIKIDTGTPTDIVSQDVYNSNDDKTQPAEEILNVLNALNPKTISNATQNGHGPDLVPQDMSQDSHQDPPSEWHALREKLREHPQDPEGWNKLVDIAENAGDLEQIKQTYEALLETYPNTSSAQIAYLNHFLSPGLFQYAEELFKRFLRTSPLVDLWKFYLTYVRRVNTSPASREAVSRAYEFALNRIGQDKDSGEIWSDYIQFLKAGETSTTWEEQQKMDALRKVYHRAVQIPLENVEKLWSELETFENSLNKITAKKFMTDLSPSYMQARTVLRQLQRHLGPLFPPPPASSTSRPPIYLPPAPVFNAAERALVGSWKTYLKWEESNPLEFEEKDKATLISRIQGVYRKAVIRMRYYSEIWYMAFVWTASIGKQEEALNVLKAGMEANPTSFLLHFAYAEAQEGRKEYGEVTATFDKLLDTLRVELEEFESRVNSANSSFSSDASGRTVPVGAPNIFGTSLTGLTEAGTVSNNSSFVTQVSDEKPPKSKELQERRTEYGLVWIMYIRYARRAHDLKTFRAVFAKARKDRWTSWEVYEAAALMEYHCNKDGGMGVASRIFEKGLESFGDEIEFVLRYLGFLISVNDDNNARALFERVIPTFSAERARPLWERWARYEYQFGDLEAAQKLEKRIAEVYPTDPPIKRFAQRHTYLGTDAIAARDLGFAMAGRQPVGASSSTSSLEKRTDSLLSITSAAHMPPIQPPPKRQASPELKRREESVKPEFAPPAKRARPMSPPRERDRDRFSDGPRKRFGSPAAWEKDRDREPLPMKRDREHDDKSTTLPAVLTWFVGQLPNPASFDGPIFRTDDLMMLFRNAVIPSATRRPSPPPGPPPRGRPPPDYGPYQGPGGGRGRRY
ncbi:Suppressor of forked protein (Suf) domain containing protein [Tylopilus felleus]